MSDYLGAYGDDAIAGTQWVGAVSRLGEPLVQGGFLGGDFLALAPGFLSDDATESIATLQPVPAALRSRRAVAGGLASLLGFNAVVPPHVREGLLARHVNNDA